MAAGVSRYLDIAADLRTRILGGEWEPGATLPRMSDLARGYGVNRDTLARAPWLGLPAGRRVGGCGAQS